MKSIILTGLFLTSSAFAIEATTMGYLKKEKYLGVTHDSYTQRISLDKFSVEQKSIAYACAESSETHALIVKTFETHELISSGPKVQYMETTVHVSEVSCVETPAGFRKFWKRTFGGFFNFLG